MTTVWTGHVDFAQAGEKLLASAREALAAAADDVLARSNALVPVNSGNLEASGKTSMESEDQATIEYDADYAVIQHERTEWHHAQGQAKFLETALLDSTRTEQILGEHIRAALEL